jgi:hypothetical protein
MDERVCVSGGRPRYAIYSLIDLSLAAKTGDMCLRPYVTPKDGFRTRWEHRSGVGDLSCRDDSALSRESDHVTRVSFLSFTVCRLLLLRKVEPFITL